MVGIVVIVVVDEVTWLVSPRIVMMMIMGWVGPPHPGDDAAAIAGRIAVVIRPRRIVSVGLWGAGLDFTLLAIDQDMSGLTRDVREEGIRFCLQAMTKILYTQAVQY